MGGGGGYKTSQNKQLGYKKIIHPNYLRNQKTITKPLEMLLKELHFPSPKSLLKERKWSSLTPLLPAKRVLTGGEVGGLPQVSAGTMNLQSGTSDTGLSYCYV